MVFYNDIIRERAHVNVVNAQKSSVSANILLKFQGNVYCTKKLMALLKKQKKSSLNKCFFGSGYALIAY